MYDVWDGSVLRCLSKAGHFFSTKCNLAFSLNTDEIPLYKSSSWGLWPVFLTILNLPPAIRMKAENILLAALWYGPGKPPMWELLGPALKHLQQLSAGVTIHTPDGPRSVRGRLVMGVFDLPAKAAVLSVKQFNGKHGCTVCTHPGKKIGRNTRVYPPQMYPERTHEAAAAAHRSNCAVDGVKGLSPLAQYVDLVVSIPVDYMHAVLEGVVKMLMKTWFDSKHHRGPQYIGRRTAAVDAQLMRQRLPLEFSHPPRSIGQHLHYWKASELRNWLLYYSLPLLLPHLPPLYWHHYALLVCAVHILLKDTLADAEIDAAEQMLYDFLIMLPDLYPERCCTVNSHLLSHLAKYARAWGPLWTHSSFGYENKNGHIKQFIHNRSEVVSQLLFNIDVHITLQQLYPVLTTTENSETLDFLSGVSGTDIHVRRNMMKVDDHVYAVGKLSLTVLTEDQACALGVERGAVAQTFLRLYKDGALYHSQAYSRSEGKRDSTVCHYQGDEGICFGRIHIFIAHPQLCALVQTLKVTSSPMQQAGPPCRETLSIHRDVDILHQYIQPVSACDELRTVPLKSLTRKAVLLYGRECNYVAAQPNTYEKH